MTSAQSSDVSYTVDNLPNIDHEVDTTSLLCPEPVMMLHQAIRKASSGDCIHVLATDPSTTRDIPKFCLHLGHELVHQNTDSQLDDEHFHYYVVKK